MTDRRFIPLLLVALIVSLSVSGCFFHRVSPLLNPSDARFARPAPDSFDVEMTTTKGVIVVRVHRDWSPHGVDRFHALVSEGFYNDVAFHRTVRNFVAQFGISGDPTVSAAWNGKNIPDDPVRVKNERGTLVYARGGPNSRQTQLYFNLVSNSPRLDTLGGIGFPPIGRVTQGLSVMDSLNSEYSSGRAAMAPQQDSIRRGGNAYLRRLFPRLDYIVSARVVRKWYGGAVEGAK
jgi:cyclophilin family peptidyl-prolyl cis-trans isomerase